MAHQGWKTLDNETEMWNILRTRAWRGSSRAPPAARGLTRSRALSPPTAGTSGTCTCSSITWNRCRATSASWTCCGTSTSRTTRSSLPRRARTLLAAARAQARAQQPARAPGHPLRVLGPRGGARERQQDRRRAGGVWRAQGAARAVPAQQQADLAALGAGWHSDAGGGACPAAAAKGSLETLSDVFSPAAQIDCSGNNELEMVPLELRGDRMLIKFICKMHLDHRTAIEQLMGQNRDRELAARNAELSVLRLRVSSLSRWSARLVSGLSPLAPPSMFAGRNFATCRRTATG